ncbi:MAG: PAS domain S-box protein [Gammaproteobacteria bacterium]
MPSANNTEDQTLNEALLYRAIVENTSQSIFACDLDGRYIFVNQAAAARLGTAPEQIVGKLPEAFFPPQTAASFKKSIRAVAASGKGIMHEETFKIGGQSQVFRTSIEPIRDARGQVVSVHAIVNDLSEIRNAEHLLRRSEELLTASLQVAELGIFEHDQLRDSVYWSPRQRDIHGWGSEETVSLDSFMQIVHPDDREWVLASILHAHHPDNDGNWDVEHRILRRDGSVRWLRSRSRTFFEGEGEARRPLRTIGANRDITAEKELQLERERADAALRNSEAHLEEAQRIARVGSWTWDPATGRGTWSKELFVILELAPAEAAPSLAEQAAIYSQESMVRMREAMAKSLQTGKAYSIEMERIRLHAPSTWLQARGEAVFDVNERITGLRGTVLDITEAKTLQLQLLQAQKMESIGLLAGGVAHDFNNLLTVIHGYLDLAQMQILPTHPVQDYLAQIQNAASSAATLTEQLLAFSRKQIIAPKVLDLNDTITRMQQMLQRLLGEDIELKTILSPELWYIRFDPGQVEQIIMNLAANARDAMRDGGKVTVETANVHLGQDYAGYHAEAKPGDYIMLAVSDNGSGMSAEVRAHLFDPFFTTKETGKGTGLGLAMVYGAVKQNGGNIEIYSEPGHGSSFKIYIPRVDAASEWRSEATQAGLPQGMETIMLVEDEDAVRMVATLLLQRQGYKVYAFANGQAAIAAVQEMTEPLHLLITDVIMPGMNGRVLAEQLVALRPTIKVLFASGYTANVIVHHGVLKDGVEFLAKPYSQGLLARRVRELLDRR